MILVKVPSEQGSLEKNIGCAKAPESLLSSLSINPEQVDEVRVEKSDIEETDKAIFEKTSKLLKSESRLFLLGGDHSITYSSFSAFSSHFSPEQSSLLIFDAHADSYQSFKPVSHEDMNRVLVEEKSLLPSNLMIVGVRSIYPPEQEFIEKHSIQTISSEQVSLEPFHSLQQVEGFVAKAKNLYVSIDIDAFDPSIAPATGYVEENGLLWKQFSALLSPALKSGKLWAGDLVEFNPLMRGAEKTQILCENIIKKFL